MDVAFPSYDDECPRNSYSLEQAYHESTRNSGLIIKEETARRLRLQLLLLDYENDELHEQLATRDDRTDELEQECSELRKQMEEGEIETQRRETELKTRARELNNLKAELGSMNGISVDSAKLLTEKLSLARELATLKPELDHLRSQVTLQQTLLAEKLALQRQVSTLEVEVETEKRAAMRADHKEKESEKEFELHKKVDELRKELSKERREKEKAHAAVEKGLSEGETRKAAMESKIEQLRAKLRETKDQMKKLQMGFAQGKAIATSVPTAAANEEVNVMDSRKRNAVQISTDVAFCTPDGVAVRAKRVAARRGKPDQTLLGEKSTFSITPFLTRTIGVISETAPDDRILKHGRTTKREENEPTPTGGEEQAIVEEITTHNKGDATDTLSPLMKHTNKTAEEAILKDSKKGRMNSKAWIKKSCILGTLERVVEEGVDENTVPGSAAMPLKVPKQISQQQAKTLENVEPKKKKRKLLGTVKTLFDEEDGEVTRRPAKIEVGVVRSLSKVVLGGGKGVVQTSLGASTGAIGAFSPLKKHKKGGQASFLA